MARNVEAVSRKKADKQRLRGSSSRTVTCTERGPDSHEADDEEDGGYAAVGAAARPFPQLHVVSV